MEIELDEGTGEMVDTGARYRGAEWEAVKIKTSRRRKRHLQRHVCRLIVPTPMSTSTRAPTLRPFRARALSLRACLEPPHGPELMRAPACAAYGLRPRPRLSPHSEPLSSAARRRGR